MLVIRVYTMKTNTKAPLGSITRRRIMRLCEELDVIRSSVASVAFVALRDQGSDDDSVIPNDVVIELGSLLSKIATSQHDLRHLAIFMQSRSGVKHRARNRTLTGIG